MTAGLEPTTGLHAFVRAVETGSFSAAARLAGTTPSAVSKSVERLERRLGVKLFLRSTRSLTLTVDGTAYYERSEEHTSELQSLMRISYAVFCLKKKKNNTNPRSHHIYNRTNTTLP